jgi:hypothetical protein
MRFQDMFISLNLFESSVGRVFFAFTDGIIVAVDLFRDAVSTALIT